MTDPDYIAAADATRIRLYHEGEEWFIDGGNEAGGYTEAVWSFDTKAEAEASVDEFRANHGIPAVPVVEQ